MTGPVSFDVAVVGSGASAVHVAWPLVHARLRVGMLDVGHRDQHYASLVPQKSFTEVRHLDPAQHRYFLGDQFEGIAFGRVRVGAQLTPPRLYIIHDTDRLAPLVSDTLSALQSLALGGLGAGWGASTMPFSEADLASWPIGRPDLQPHYDAIAARIGICGTNDDLEPFIGHVDGLMSPTHLDSNAEGIYARYLRKRADLNRAGFYMGRPWLAVATREHRGRGPLQYHDMEFWSDHDRSVYRPQYTVEELQRFPNFSYHDGLLVERFEQGASGEQVIVSCLNLKTGRREQLTARRLVLAAGTLGTARIVLRSLNRFDEPVPLLTNPYTYFPCLNLPQLGKATRDARYSLAQLTMIFDPAGTRRHVLQLQLYSYRSLLLFKLVKESPLAYRESLRLMHLLQDCLVIVWVFHEDHPAKNKFIKLSGGRDGQQDWLEATYQLDAHIEQYQRRQERRILKCLLKLGCLPLKAIRLGHGSSIHYAGSFPMAHDGPPLTTRPTGQLRAAPLVYLADGSTFPNLPTKSITFTLMANANRIGGLLRDALLKRDAG